LCPLAKCHFHERGGIDVHVKQIGHNAAHVAQRTLGVVVGHPQNFLHAATEPLQPMFQFGKHGNPLARAGQAGFQVSMLLVRTGQFTADMDETLLRSAKRRLKCFGLGRMFAFRLFVARELGRLGVTQFRQFRETLTMLG
jgi:hypothetical protein